MRRPGCVTTVSGAGILGIIGSLLADVDKIYSLLYTCIFNFFLKVRQYLSRRVTDRAGAPGTPWLSLALALVGRGRVRGVGGVRGVRGVRGVGRVGRVRRVRLRRVVGLVARRAQLGLRAPGVQQRLHAVVGGPPAREAGRVLQPHHHCAAAPPEVHFIPATYLY